MKKNHKIAVLLTSIIFLSACQEGSVSSNQATEPEKPTIKASEPEHLRVDKMAQAEPNDSDATINGVDLPLEFSLSNLDGEIISATDFRGKWLVINYWATWCAPCRDEMPELVKFQSENKDNVQVIGIAYEDAEVQKLKNFAADFEINYPLLTIDIYNPPGFAEEGGLGLPTTIVYNPAGMRHKKHMGPIDAAGLLEMVQ